MRLVQTSQLPKKVDAEGAEMPFYGYETIGVILTKESFEALQRRFPTSDVTPLVALHFPYYPDLQDGGDAIFEHFGEEVTCGVTAACTSDNTTYVGSCVLIL